MSAGQRVLLLASRGRQVDGWPTDEPRYEQVFGETVGVVSPRACSISMHGVAGVARAIWSGGSMTMLWPRSMKPISAAMVATARRRSSFDGTFESICGSF
jgi:hypothetical protein